MTLERERQTPVVAPIFAVGFTHSESASQVSIALHGMPSAMMVGQTPDTGPPVIAECGHDPRRQRWITPSHGSPGAPTKVNSHSPSGAQMSPDEHAAFPAAGSLHDVPAGPGAWHVGGLPAQ
ncbi:MAG TPA: hypothetical protein VH142_24190 [Polyangiaceae bacterium]|nr:hypothetical protein [Polyangiaceae bacterium]